MHESKRDSTEQFSDFDSKNTQYYESAGQHLASIKDSVLRQVIKDKIENSLVAYSKQTTYHNNLLSILEKRQLSLSDLHTLLKLNRTLPVIEKYQQQNLPRITQLEGIIKKI